MPRICIYCKQVYPRKQGDKLDECTNNDGHTFKYLDNVPRIVGDENTGTYASEVGFKPQRGRSKTRKHNPKWKDTTRNERQRKRRQQLNEIAKRHGYDTWTKLETAAINGEILGDDDE